MEDDHPQPPGSFTSKPNHATSSLSYTFLPPPTPGLGRASGDQEHSIIASDHWEDIDTAEDVMSARSETSSRAGPSTPRKASSVVGRGGTNSPTPSKRSGTTPVRRRKPPRPARPELTSPRVSESRTSTGTISAIRASSPLASTLSGTFSALLAILRVGASIFNILLGPIIYPMIYTTLAISLLSLAAYYLLPHLPRFVLLLIGKLVRLLARTWTPSIPSLNGWVGWNTTDVRLGQEALSIPFRAIVAAPACAITGVLCPLSIVTRRGPDGVRGEEPDVVARPFWQWDMFGGGSSAVDIVDVGRVARGLTKEIKQARDIFDSVRMLGDGTLIGGLEYVRIWELGVAVQTGSNLDDKAMVGAQLMELGDMTRDLYDELGGINNMAVNAFNWIHWEFASLVKLLSLPSSQQPSNETVTRRLHTLVMRIDTALQTLHQLTSQSTLHAQGATSHGQELFHSLKSIQASLKREQDLSPKWKLHYDVIRHSIVGGEPTRLELLARDLDITRNTIGGLDTVRSQLEGVRRAVKDYRDQIGMSQASMMGVHLGVGESGMSAEEEVKILQELVDGLGSAVGKAKERPAMVREDNGPLGIEAD